MAKILIVDDSRTSRKILRTILEGAGHEVVGEAVDGVDGVNTHVCDCKRIILLNCRF